MNSHLYFVHVQLANHGILPRATSKERSKILCLQRGSSGRWCIASPTALFRLSTASFGSTVSILCGTQSLLPCHARQRVLTNKLMKTLCCRKNPLSYLKSRQVRKTVRTRLFLDRRLLSRFQSRAFLTNPTTQLSPALFP